MQEVKKCSISGIAFTLEVDAWEALNAYLETLSKQYESHEDGEEIIADIEARVAELILSVQDNGRTVELPLIKNIIAQLGSPEQIDQDSKSGGSAEREEGNGGDTPRIPRRLYRDPEGAKLGGVCTGLGRYFDIDPVWIRLILISPLFLKIISSSMSSLYWFDQIFGNLFGGIVIGYIIMWFAVPTARTARQKLEMSGERITTRSIQDKTELRSDVDGRSKAVVADTVSGVGLVIVILLKILAGLLVAGLMILACALIIGLFALFFTNISIVPGEIFPQSVGVLGILTALIPTMLLIYVLMCLIASTTPSGRSILVIFIVWVLVIMSLCITTIKNYYDVEKYVTELPSPTPNEKNILSDDYLSDGVDTTTITTPDTEITLEVSKDGAQIDIKDAIDGSDEHVRLNIRERKR